MHANFGGYFRLLNLEPRESEVGCQHFRPSQGMKQSRIDKVKNREWEKVLTSQWKWGNRTEPKTFKIPEDTTLSNDHEGR